MFPGASTNQRKILLDMANIGGGAPSTILMGHFMVFTWTIQPINMMSGNNKIRGRDNNKKGQIPSYKVHCKLK